MSYVWSGGFMFMWRPTMTYHKNKYTMNCHFITYKKLITSNLAAHCMHTHTHALTTVINPCSNYSSSCKSITLWEALLKTNSPCILRMCKDSYTYFPQWMLHIFFFIIFFFYYYFVGCYTQSDVVWRRVVVLETMSWSCDHKSVVFVLGKTQSCLGLALQRLKITLIPWTNTL